MIALGDKAVQELSYCSSIHQKADEPSFETSEEMAIPIENADFSSNALKIVEDEAQIDTHKVIPENAEEVISESA